MLGRVAGQRREPVAAAQPPLVERGREGVRARVELRVRRLRVEEVDRDPVRRGAGAVADPAAERQRPAHARNSSTAATKPSGSSQKKRCPRPSNRRTRASGIRSARSAALRESTTPSSVPWRISVGAPMSADPVEGVEARPRRGLRLPAGRVGRAREPVRVDAADELLRRVVRERVLDEAPQRDLRRERRRLGDERERPLRQRERARAARGRAREDEPVDALRAGERELLRHHPAEARPDDVRPVDPGLVEHLRRVLGHRRGGVRPGRHLALADAAVVEEEHAEALRQPVRDRLPAPARVAEAMDQQQRRPVAPRLPGDAHHGASPTPTPGRSRTLASRRRSPRRGPAVSAPTIPPGRK